VFAVSHRRTGSSKKSEPGIKARNAGLIIGYFQTTRSVCCEAPVVKYEPFGAYHAR
jgi:hypothetical protein